MDLQEDTENGIPSSLQATFAMLIAEKDALKWNSNRRRSLAWQLVSPAKDFASRKQNSSWKRAL